MRISYAQNFEDVTLMRALGGVQRGFYIDIGAQDPVRDSVSLAFYEAGWRGIHVEPVPEFASRIEAARPDEQIIQAVVRNEREPLMFYSVTDTGMSTGDPEIATKHLKAGFAVSALLVESLPLSEVLQLADGRPIHWLKVDVEGMEQVVLESWGDCAARPWVVVVESTKPNSTETTHEEWEHLLIQRGYEFAYFDGLNRFYISAERSELKAAFTLPPNYFDDFSVTEHSAFARLPLIKMRELDAERQAAHERAEALTAHVEATEAHIEHLIGRLGELDSAIADMVRQKAAAEADLVRQKATAEQARAETEARIAHLTAHAESVQRANQTHHDLWQAAERAIIEIRTSSSWKATAPLRRSVLAARYALKGMAAWLTLRPESRPRRLARRLVKMFRGPIPVGWAAAPSLSVTLTESGARYIFVDHTATCSTNTGVQRVVRGLCKAYLASGAPVRFVKWDNAAKACVLINLEERAWLSRWNGPAVRGSEAGVYPVKGSPPVVVTPTATTDGRLLVPEVTHMSAHGPSTTESLIAWARNNGLRTGFVFYDAIPLERPEFAAIAGTHAQYMRELRMADTIWPISRWSADDLASFWGADREVDNSYLPLVHPVHLPAEFDSPRIDKIRQGEKLILAVGTLEPRKNQTTVISAFQAILAERPGCDWKLVLAGNLHPAVADAVHAATSSTPAIEFRGHVPDAELSALYDSCAFTVFASTSEGYGLPILESLWHAKPCLCADFGAMGELAATAAGGCLAIDVRDEAAIKAALVRLMDEEDLRRSLSAQAVAAPMPTWTSYLADMEASGSGDPSLIYYWVDTTVSFPANTGIQRVARQLARGLIEAGFKLVPVKWGGPEHPFHKVSPEELAHFASWNGPAVEQWNLWTPPETHRGAGWFVMTELPLNLSDVEQKLVRQTANAASLRTAAVFYDTIPWKMRDIYPAAFSSAHRTYIGELANYDLVLPISHYSREEMATVLRDEFGLGHGQLGHVIACPLPGEFPESAEAEPPTPREHGAIDILCVGTVEPRKNHKGLLDAFERASAKAKTPLRLTIVGGGHSIEPDLAVRVRRRVDANPHIVWEEGADDARIKQLYNQCAFTVYPSVEEGFGLPILESLWYGKPCICADFGSMAEVAEGGGCVMVDVRDAKALAAAIAALADSPARLQRLTDEARARRFQSWTDYAGSVARRLGLWRWPDEPTVRRRREVMGLAKRPVLSVCISTYNRAQWLSTALRNLAQLHPSPIEGVEFVICDNASTDQTPQVVKSHLNRPDFTYRRNRVNVGMLGNLRETAQAASGEYIWILGDDDLVKPGAIERVLKAIRSNSGAALIYLNYAFTRIDDARTVTDFGQFFADATPIVPPEGDLVGPIRAICARNENFFTAIYTLVFRRDHALKAYSQDTSGRPFSTMLTCIPTTYYVLHNMMEETGVWIGEPLIVVNMNVSWMRYAPLWILERIPEVYEVARAKGVPATDIDRWRRHTLPGVEHFFSEIFTNDPLDNAAYLSPARLVGRFADLPEFQAHKANMIEAYTRAHHDGHPAATEFPDLVFGEFAALEVGAE